MLPEQILKKPRLHDHFVVYASRPALFTAFIIFLEMLFRIWVFRSLSSIGTLYSVLFAFPVGILLSVISSVFPERVNRLVTVLTVLGCTLVFAVQIVYFGVFKTFLSLYSISGAGQVLQFWSSILWAIRQNLFILIPMFLPLAALLIFGLKRLSFERLSPGHTAAMTAAAAAAHIVALTLMLLPGRGTYTPYDLYYTTFVPQLSVQRLGLITTMRLDLQHLLFGFRLLEPGDETSLQSPSSGSSSGTFSQAGPSEQSYGYNIMDIDFDALIAGEEDETLLDMHRYFSGVEPTRRNKYTGLFKGCNLVLITAESFSHYVIEKDLTPTLYKLATEGFNFTNFYNPIWGVSTSDGEYVACTGLIPKSGVWSMYRSGEAKNWLPFVMGNQFLKLGVTPWAYHNHTHTYYKRHISHPNMGYVFKAVGSGLDVKKTWPESDLEMIDLSTADYLGKGRFHAYYMTVSGHLNYTFSDNYMASKNRSLVEDLPYSDHVKAYLACNIELDRALELLLKRLEGAGALDNTVIALSADHYPYGLSTDEISELAGHEVEENFELYKSAFILWKNGMKPVTITKPCSSLDVIPTISNLLGLDYDSRLLMGRDILSDSEPLVIFSDRSWISGIARYNAYANTLESLAGDPVGKDYLPRMNKIVNDKFKYSAKVLEKDYYRVVLPPES